MRTSGCRLTRSRTRHDERRLGHIGHIATGLAATARPPPLAALALRWPLPAARAAEEPVLNLYSARHYQTDEALYENFTRATGIRINRIEAGDEQLLERIRSEGAMSPADILMIVDAARLWSAQQQGLFQPVKIECAGRRGSRRRCAIRTATGSASRAAPA